MGTYCSFVVTGRLDLRTCRIANMSGWKRSSFNNFSTDRSAVGMYSRFGWLSRSSCVIGTYCSFVVTDRLDVRTCSIASIFGWKSSPFNNFMITDRSAVGMYSRFWWSSRSSCARWTAAFHVFELGSASVAAWICVRPQHSSSSRINKRSR